MIVIIDKTFEKDIEIISDRKLLNSIADKIENIQKAKKLNDIHNCKKLRGSKNSYRIRIGDYRIGFIYENKIVELIRFLHRNKIYNYFPD